MRKSATEIEKYGANIPILVFCRTTRERFVKSGPVSRWVIGDAGIMAILVGLRDYAVRDYSVRNPSECSAVTSMSENACVLLVEDNPDVAAGLHDYLGQQGFIVDAAADGPHALRLALTRHYDAIVLDLLLPGLDGLTLCHRLRDQAGLDTPVLMLTALDTLEDKLAGFDSGADDYLVKPFEPQELVARLRALLIRAGGGRRRRLAIGDLCFDTRTQEAYRGQRPLRLNTRCRRLLEALMRASPEVVARERLERLLWGDDPPDSDSLRTHIYLLRREVDGPADDPMIFTVHGHGYRLLAAPPAD